MTECLLKVASLVLASEGELEPCGTHAASLSRGVLWRARPLASREPVYTTAAP
jgi:hypothetical protein